MNVIKVTDLTLKWGDYPGLSEWFKSTTKSLKKRESERGLRDAAIVEAGGG